MKRREQIIEQKIKANKFLTKSDLIYLGRHKSDLIALLSENDKRRLNKLQNKTIKKTTFQIVEENKKYAKSIKLEYSQKVNFKSYPLQKGEDLIASIDNSYLYYLLNDIFNKELNSDYLIALKNLLYDLNFNINHIGVKINIAKYLAKIDLNDLKVLKIKNNYLNKRYAFLVYKNDKTKENKNKLYFINNVIIVNSLDDDRIFSFALYHKDNNDLNILGKYLNENIKTNDIKFIENLNEYKYRYYDKEEKAYNNIIDLLDTLQYFKREYKNLNVTFEDLNDNNIYSYFSILRENYKIFYRYDNLKIKYDYIEQFLKDKDIFENQTTEEENKKSDLKEFDIDYKKYENDFKDKSDIINIDFNSSKDLKDLNKYCNKNKLDNRLKVFLKY